MGQVLARDQKTAQNARQVKGTEHAHRRTEIQAEANGPEEIRPHDDEEQETGLEELHQNLHL